MTVIGKPHPFSKEGRALRAAQAEQTTEQTDTVKTVETETKQDPSLKAILARLETLEQENLKLKENDPVSIALKKREIYKGPRHYSFSLWGGVPVLSWESVKMDKTRDLMFQNQYGVWESNHALKLKLADGTEAEVEVNLFNREKQKSNKMPCKVTTDENGNETYTFNSPYGEVTILSSKFLN